MTAKPDHAARRATVMGRLLDRGVEGLLVTDLTNVRYLTGFTGSNGALLCWLDPKTAMPDGVFLTDGRYKDQARDEVTDLDHIISRDFYAEASSILNRVNTWAIETHAMSIDERASLPAIDFASAQRVVERVREVKDEIEIAALRSACHISTSALTELLEGPLLGRSEKEIARDLEWKMLGLGAEAIAFETIVASGPNSAIPHHRPTSRRVERGDFLKIDFGARVDGYHADCTRTVIVGAAADWQREIYTAVQEAQRAGVAALSAGTRIADVDAVVRGNLDDSGWLEHFTTGLGHGVGLQIHEDPFFRATYDGRLTPCMTLTMEPGIYLPGRGGVRIEDTVLVTSPGNGPDVLTDVITTDLLEIA